MYKLSLKLSRYYYISYKKSHSIHTFNLVLYSRIRGRTFIIWGGVVVRIFENGFFFFGDPPNDIFLFFAKIDRRNLFLITWFYRKNSKKIFLGLNWPDVIFFSEAPWMNFFFRRPFERKFFFFSYCTTTPQMINGRPLIYMYCYNCSLLAEWRIIETGY